MQDLGLKWSSLKLGIHCMHFIQSLRLMHATASYQLVPHLMLNSAHPIHVTPSVALECQVLLILLAVSWGFVNA